MPRQLLSRSGQASRHGYIVIAPEWTEEHQKQYNYSAREHAAVLNSLRDACRRFSIDTDRVYLSGYSMGGDAAWDIGLAHPDLWAGVIPISAQSDRYCNFYWENAKYVPFYVVLGELDGAKLTKNALDLDRYLKRGYDATVVEYEGRGHDDFHEEILRIFDWMGRFRRNFFPREFACSTMRDWDSFFWWVELDGMPPRSQIDPADWPPPSGTRPAQVKGTILNNNINIRTGSAQVSVWVSPQMVDFKQRVNIRSTASRSTPKNHSSKPICARSSKTSAPAATASIHSGPASIVPPVECAGSKTYTIDLRPMATRLSPSEAIRRFAYVPLILRQSIAASRSRCELSNVSTISTT